MTTDQVDIGVLEQKDSWLLHPRFFPSKIGGKPAWLDLKNLPMPSEMTCKRCEEPLIFLCQVYAPYEESSECFHRSVFIFICQNGPCCQTNSAANFLVLRCQLPRNNEFYSFEPYEENEKEDFPTDKWPKLCDVCGMKGPSHCSKCKKAFYCSRKHQILDWKKGHKETCSEIQASDKSNSSNFVVTKSGKTILFEEWELVVDEEEVRADVPDIDVHQEMEKLRQLIQEKRIGNLNNIEDSELEQYTKSLPEDKVFNKFSKRVARHPDQVLRYSRGGNPLWITAKTGDTINYVPKCQYCNGIRQFEFQVMPQLLNFLNVGIDLNSIDWGVMAVYTCKASCNKGPAYKQEILIKQDLI